jgi:hypothetical protein
LLIAFPADRLSVCCPNAPVFRLGRLPSPWQPPDWFWANEDRTFGSRFDDPMGFYRVLYASSQRLSCFVETLARFRPDISLLEEFAEIDGDDDFLPLGTVPLDWLRTRRIGKAALTGTYADIYSSGWVSYLRSELAPDALQVGIPDIDVAVLQQASPRILTQKASRKVYEKKQDGIYYRSRYGHDLENWAIFEPFPLSEKKTEGILTSDDYDLQEALRILGLTLTT